MTVFVNGKIFDGEQATLIEGANVFLNGDLIAEVSDRPPNPDDGEIIDCAGSTIMPGLIDAHVHAHALSVRLHDVDRAPPSLRTAWAGRMLGNMLSRGFTTVRDTGGADYGLFLALERGYIRGPRLYYCGRAISQTGGHGDFRDPHHHHAHDDQILACGCGMVNSLGIVVDGVDAVTRVVRESLFRGSNFIKFMGSGGVSSTGDSLDSIQFSDEEVRAIVGEVERHGAYCTAHIHPDKALRRAIQLGVHCIEHGTLIEPDTARMAADAGTAIVPTMAIIASLAARGEELGYPAESLAKLATIKDQAVGRMQHMKDAGVRVGFGTDLLGALENDQLTEFHIRSNIFSNIEILRQATSGNAEIIGAKGELGIIRKGAKADLLVVEGDPLADLAVIATPGRPPEMIYSRGRKISNLRH
jgi:imidazolonepropionase-like amidohydrolase